MKQYCLIPRQTAEKYLGSIFPTNQKEKETASSPSSSSSSSIAHNYRNEEKIKSGARKGVKKIRVERIKKNNVMPDELKLKLNKKKNDEYWIQRDRHPPLDDLVAMEAAKTQVGYITSVIARLRGNSAIAWDSLGNLTSPITNFNIIDVLKKFADSTSKTYFNDDEIPYLKIFLRDSGLRESQIKNKKVRKQLYGGGQATWVAYRP